MFEEIGRVGGASDTLGLISSDAVNMQLWRGQEVVVSPRLVPYVIAVYDLAGGAPRAVGRQGEGPGEYERIAVTAVDSMGRFHAFAEGRETVVARNGALIDTRPAPGRPQEVLFLSSGKYVLHGFIPTRDRAGFSLHVVSPDGEVLRSFGPETRGPELGQTSLRTLAHSGRERFWAAQINRYRLAQWDTAGNVLRTVERTPSWFEPWQNWTRPWEGKPQPRVASLYEDLEGRIWVMIYVADDDFRPISLADVKMRGTIDAGDHPLYDTIIEVLDLGSGELVLSERFDRMFSGYHGGGVVSAWDTTPMGHQLVSFFRVRIEDSRN